MRVVVGRELFSKCSHTTRAYSDLEWHATIDLIFESNHQEVKIDPTTRLASKGRSVAANVWFIKNHQAAPYYDTTDDPDLLQGLGG